MRHYNENSASTYHPRSPEQITAFFDGLDLVEAGVVELSQWRPAVSGQRWVPGMGGVAQALTGPADGLVPAASCRLARKVAGLLYGPRESVSDAGDAG